METVFHTLVWNLDSGNLEPSDIDFPRGYNHLITIRTIAAGVDVQPTGLKIEISGEFPVEAGNRILTTGPSSWDATTERSTLSVNTAGAPMGGYGQTSLAAKLTCSVSSTPYAKNFHVGFLSTPSPKAVTGGLPPGLPQAFKTWLNNNWPISYLDLTQKPTDIPSFSVGEIIGAQFPTLANMTGSDAAALTNNVIVQVAGYSAAGDGGGGNFVYRLAASPPPEVLGILYHAASGGSTVGYYERL